MPMHETRTRASTLPFAGRAMVAFLRRTAGSIAEWRQRQAAVQYLHGLSDEALKDIGISRSQIERAVDGRL